MKKLFAVLLCVFSLFLTTTVVFADDFDFSEFSPEQYDGWGIQNCVEGTINWTIGIGLDSHKKYFESITGANPSSFIVRNVGDLITITIPDNQIVDEESLSITLPAYVANENGYMTKYYYDIVRFDDNKEVSSHNFTSLNDFIASLKKDEYGLYTDIDAVSGKEYTTLVVKLDNSINGYYVGGDLISSADLEADFNLDSVRDADQINYTQYANTTVLMGVHINFKTIVVEPDETISVTVTAQEDNQLDVTKEITAEYCNEVRGIISINNVDQDGQPLAGTTFAVEVYDEQLGVFVPYEVNQQSFTVETSEEGNALVYGLPNGTYRLQQTTPTDYKTAIYDSPNEFVITDANNRYSVSVTNQLAHLYELIIDWQDFYDKYGWIPEGKVYLEQTMNNLPYWSYSFLGTSSESVWRQSTIDDLDRLADEQFDYRLHHYDGTLFIVQIERKDNTIVFNVVSLGWKPFVSIKWDDNDNEDGLRPESLVVTVLQDGVPYAEGMVIYQYNNSWEVEFDLIEYFADSIYTFECDEIDGYEMSVVDEYITMTRVESPNIPVVPGEDPQTPEEVGPVTTDTQSNTTTLPSTGVQSHNGSLIYLGLMLIVIGVNKKEHNGFED